MLQSIFDDHISDEERVLSAIARADENGIHFSTSYDQCRTEEFPDDYDKGVIEPMSNNVKGRQHKRKIEVVDTVKVESARCSLARPPSSRSVGIAGDQIKPTSKGSSTITASFGSEGWKSSSVQSTSTRKSANLQEQPADQIQGVKGSTQEPSNKKTSSTTTPWIRRYLSSRPKDVLLPVPKDFISDGFNVAKLAPIVERIGFQVAGEDAVAIAKQLMEVSTRSFPIYRLALQLILNENEDDNFLLRNSVVPPQVIQVAAEALYLMVHSRFCQSPRGLDSLKRIVRAEMYGKCPRVSCSGAPLLPYGTSDDFSGVLHNSSCRRFCPKCGEVWIWWDSKTDGCAFGPSLCHLFLLTHGFETLPLGSLSLNDANTLQSSFRVMGFQIHPATIRGNHVLKAVKRNL